MITPTQNKENNKDAIHQLLKMFKDDIKVVIHGGAKGADSIADHEAQTLGIPTEEYPALWSTHGRTAGAIRNQQMLDEANPDAVWAFPTDNSTGTWNMIRKAEKAGLPVYIFKKARKTSTFVIWKAGTDSPVGKFYGSYLGLTNTDCPFLADPESLTTLDIP